MTHKNDLRLEFHQSPGADVHTGTEAGTWTLKIPAGSQGNYRLAQIDDYNTFARHKFPWHPPLTLHLHARVSEPQVPGTWGFGLWNDPFSLSLGFGGGSRRFPALPNTAWFFFSSPQNYLSFRDTLPASGFLVQTFRAAHIPTPILALAALGIPLLLWPKMGRLLRPIFRGVIAEDSYALDVDVTQWHRYTLKWSRERVIFKVDDQTYQTEITPKAPLGLVIWIDNQFAAFHPNGKLAYGTLENTRSTRLEIQNLSIRK
jgi:hypothetical protein